MPRWARDAAIDAFTSREPDLGVLDCAFDSLVDSPHRAEPGRRLMFSGFGLRADVLVVGGAMLTLQIRLFPAEQAHVDLRSALQSLGTDTTGDGLAELPGVRPGLVSLVLAWPQRPTVRTAWMRL